MVLERHDSEGRRPIPNRTGKWIAVASPAPQNSAMTTDLLLFYGLLLRGQSGWVELGLDACLEEVGPDSVAGTLYDLGEFPGALVGGEGRVHGMVFRLTDPAALPRLDAFEDYDPDQPEASLYVRVTATTADGRTVWVYVYNRNVMGRPVIASGRWADRTA